MSMQTRLVQAGHATKEAANTACRQMRALRTEEERLQSKCETAKASIRTNTGDIQSQFDNRKAYFEHNLEHAAQRHSFLKHRKPRETLSMEYETLQELQKHGEDVLTTLASEDAMSLGEVEKATDRLKKVQNAVKLIQSQCSMHTSQFEADPSKVRAKLSNYGEVYVDTFEQEPFTRCNSLQPYECKFKSQQRQQSASDMPHTQVFKQSSSFKPYSRMQRPPIPKKPSLKQQSVEAIKTSRKNFVLPPLPQASSPTPLLPSQVLRINSLRPDKIQDTEENYLEILFSSTQEEPDDIYDDAASPPLPDDLYDDAASPPLPPRSSHFLPPVPAFSAHL